MRQRGKGGEGRYTGRGKEKRRGKKKRKKKREKFVRIDAIFCSLFHRGRPSHFRPGVDQTPKLPRKKCLVAIQIMTFCPPLGPCPLSPQKSLAHADRQVIYTDIHACINWILVVPSTQQPPLPAPSSAGDPTEAVPPTRLPADCRRRRLALRARLWGPWPEWVGICTCTTSSASGPWRTP